MADSDNTFTIEIKDSGQVQPAPVAPEPPARPEPEAAPRPLAVAAPPPPAPAAPAGTASGTPRDIAARMPAVSPPPKREEEPVVSQARPSQIEAKIDRAERLTAAPEQKKIVPTEAATTPRAPAGVDESMLRELRRRFGNVFTPEQLAGATVQAHHAEAAGPAAGQAEAGFDPVAEAQALIDKDERRQKIEAARLDLLQKMGKIQDQEKAFDPVIQARKLLELEVRRAQVKEAYLRLRPAAPEPAFDPVAEAQKLIEKKKRAQQVKSAYLNITEGPADALPAEEGKPSGLKAAGQVAQKMGLGDIGKLLSAIGSSRAGIGAAAGAGELAAGATAGEAALGGLAAAAGGAGAALAVADIAARFIAKAINETTKQIQGMGHEAAMLAGNDNLGAMVHAVDRTAESLGKIPVVGQILEAEIKFATGVVKAFTEMTDAFVRRGRELAQYSGPLTQASVTADIRSMMADIREAQELGPDLANLIDAQSRASTELRELLLPIKKVIVEVLAGILETVADWMQDVRLALADAKVIWQTMLDLVNDIFGDGKIADIPELLKKLPERIAEAEKKIRDQTDIKAAIDDQLAALKDLGRQAGLVPFGGNDPLEGARVEPMFAFGGPQL